MAEVLVAGHDPLQHPRGRLAHDDLLGADHDLGHPAPRRPAPPVQGQPAEPRGDDPVADLAFEHVGLAEEHRQLRVPRVSVQPRRCVELGDGPVPEHGHLVGHGQGLVLVVGDQYGGGAGIAQDLQHVGADRGAQRGIERGERLVEQYDLGFDGQGPGQGDPLLLPARELMRVTPAQAGQPDELDQFADPGLALRAARRARRRYCDRRSGAERARPLGARSRCAGAPRGRTGAARRPRSRRPSAIWPSSGRSNPATMRSRVVLPLPDAPRIAVNDPCGTVRSTPRRTRWAPNDFVRPLMRRSFMPAP